MRPPSTPNPINSSTTGTSAVTSYVYAATPLNVGQTGVRGFGGDSSGVLCQNPTGVMVGNANGALTIGTNCDVLQ